MTTDILHKVPNPPFEVEIMDRAPVEVTNPFSGEKVMLEPIEEYQQIEDKWYELHETGSLPFSPVEDDPINHMETVI